MEFSRIELSGVGDDGNVSKVADSCICTLNPSTAVGLLKTVTGDHQFSLKDAEFCPLGANSVGLRPSGSSVGWMLRFPDVLEANRFSDALRLARKSAQTSIFEMRTDEASASQYFQFYGYLSQQQNMMQDYIRTATYQKAMLSNLSDFKDKVVLDVGAGSGILSFFALQSGARKVYAVEASSMAVHCENLVKFNRCEGKIIVVAGKIEEVNIPEQVDTIISEPMGYMLLNERMLESFLHGKKFLKPGGKMYPSRGDLHMAPFSDEGLFIEQCSKANFWCQEYFYGVNLSSLREQALKEYFKQPVVDTFDIRMCMAKTQTYTIDFAEADESTLHRIEIPLSFLLLQSGFIHGLAFWFDVAFIGSNQTVWLSTSPTEPLTHWYQVRCLLQKPLMGKQGHICTGKLLLQANKRQSYDVEVQLNVDGQTAENQLDLKNPYFRYTGQIVQPPPGQNTTSPTENYWNNVAVQSAGEALNSLNPGINGSVLMNGSLGPSEFGILPQQQPQQPTISQNLNLMNLYNFGHQQQQSSQQQPQHSIVNQPATVRAVANYPVASNLMIGDYVVPASLAAQQTVDAMQQRF